MEVPAGDWIAGKAWTRRAPMFSLHSLENRRRQWAAPAREALAA
jgi:hypothetical protein